MLKWIRVGNFLPFVKEAAYNLRWNCMVGERIHKIYRSIAIIAVLVLLDQLIKYLIRTNFQMGSIEYPAGWWLAFHPILNSTGSWLASGYGLQLGILAFTIINIVLMPLMIEGYRYYLSKEIKSFWIDLFFILLFAGSICSLIDKLFLGGSLDYVKFGNFFVSDLKDFYLTLSCISLFSVLILDKNLKTKIWDNKHITRDFLKFILNDLRNLKHKAQ